MEQLSEIIDTNTYPIDDALFSQNCCAKLNLDGALTLPGFLRPSAISALVEEAELQKPNAFFTSSTHNAYLTPTRPDFGADHVFNRQLSSSKGCITTDQVPRNSHLHKIYNDQVFRDFIAHVVSEKALYEYADPLSSINVHFASEGQELNWHFDNSEFAITLLLQSPKVGGDFEYVKDLRCAEQDDMNFSGVGDVLDGKTKPSKLNVEPGTLILFRGRNSIHRVTPTQGNRTRILVVFAYNSQPGIALSESARMTFFGRLN